jgi:AraC-like DNA-binding protein
MDKSSNSMDFYHKSNEEHALKPIDTTNPAILTDIKILASAATQERETQLAAKFRMHLVGMYFQSLGKEWDSNGLRESDFLHHIDLSLNGRRQVVHENRVFEMEPGEAWFLPGNFPVERRCSQQCDVLFFKFQCEWLPGVDPLLDWPGREPRLIGAIDVDEWRRWLEPDRIIGTAELLELRARLLSFLVRAIPDVDSVISGHLTTHTQFTDVFQHIELNLGADLRLGELAKIHGTSQGAFSIAFSRSTGISPKEYLTRRINQEALQMVMNTNLKIKQIADHLRFADEFYFSRFFQKLNGTPPSRYRSNFRASGAV